MGYKYTKDEILAGALALASDTGLATLSFGRVAKQLGTSDRVVVYYFPTKVDLVSEVLVAMGLELHAVLAEVLAAPLPSHVELVRAAWPLLATPDVDPTFALFFEANGLAATGQEPYATVMKQLVSGWVSLLTDCLDGPPERRRDQAEAAIALIDGLLLLRQLAGPAAADRAIRALGIKQ